MGITQCVKRVVKQNSRGRATAFGERTRCWGEFGVRVARLAGGLRSLGVRPGERVAMLALNSDRYLETYVAVPWAGAVVVPLNVRWSPAENIYAINDSGARFLLVDDTFAELGASIRSEIGAVSTVIHMGDGTNSEGMMSYEDLIESSVPIPDVGRTGEDLACIFYTGGTTGFPKGVMVSHRSLWASAAAALGLIPSLTRDAICLHAAPMFHIADFAHTMVALLAGAQHVIVPTFTPEHVLAAIETRRVTAMLLVPTMIHRLVTHPLLPKTDLSTLQHILYGASPMPEETLRHAMRALPRCRFIQAYGQTELSPIATVLTSDYHAFEGPMAGKLTSAGQAISCCEIEVVDGAGIEVSRALSERSGFAGLIRC